MSFKRVIAIDWSGCKDEAGQRRRIQRSVVDIHRGCATVQSTAGGLTRAETAGWLAAEHTSGALVGFDFGFSFPATYIDAALGPTATWEDVAAFVAESGEDILNRCEPPFWGRPGKRCPEGGRMLRLSDRVPHELTGRQPKPIFQIGGAGAVGTGSLRGIPHLLALRQAGLAVWPYDGPPAPEVSTVVEIYPRLLTGRVNKSSKAARADYVLALAADSAVEIGAQSVAAAIDSEDAFDALVSAVRMAERLLGEGFGAYGAGFYGSALVRREGWIWGLAPGAEFGAPAPP